jgi:hypothetical protein
MKTASGAGGAFDDRGNGFGPRDVDGVAALAFHNGSTGALGHHRLGRRRDAIVGRDQIPARLLAQAGSLTAPSSAALSFAGRIERQVKISTAILLPLLDSS